MERIIIYMFSGTGNTQKVTEKFAEELRLKDVEVTISPIDKEVMDSDGYDCVGIAYPVHAFSAPENVIEFVKRMPEKSLPLFFIKTSGEPLHFNDSSSSRSAGILRRKGYDIIGEYWYVMPYNMLYRHYDSMATKMWFSAMRKIEKDVKSLLDGEKKKIRRGTPVSYIFRVVEQPFMKLNGRFFTVDQTKCIQCNKCVNDCPRNNIYLKDDKIKFRGNCIGCVRCSFLCPTNAIKIGLINYWKVNGKYVYGEEEPEKAECKYLKKSYAKYIKENEKQ